LKWTSVEKWLPEESMFCICVFFIKTEMFEQGVTEGVLSDPLEARVGLCEYCFHEGLGAGFFDHKMVYFRVTHWMPLPPFPDEEKEG